jgi:hypothetical protein
MFTDNRPYAILAIAAFVAFAIILMLWALYGTNGPSSLDATKKASQTQTTGSAAGTDNKNR